MPRLDKKYDFSQLVAFYNNWIFETKLKYKSISKSIHEESFSFVNKLFPKNIINDVRVVVSSDFPYPPFEEMGLTGLSYWKDITLAGITYGNLIFAKEINESLIFHELVHVTQKYSIGYDQYHISYAKYVLGSGYENNPFEEMAYRMEDHFSQKKLEKNFVDLIIDETKQIITDTSANIG